MDTRTQEAIKSFCWKMSSRFGDREDAFLAGLAAGLDDHFQQWVVVRAGWKTLEFGNGSAAEARAKQYAESKGGKAEFTETLPPWSVRVRRAQDAMHDRRGLPEVTESDLVTASEDDGDDMTDVLAEILAMGDDDLEAEFIAMEERETAEARAYQAWWVAKVLVEEGTGDKRLDEHNKAKLAQIEAAINAYEAEIAKPPEPSEPEPQFNVPEAAEVLGVTDEGVIAKIGEHIFKNGWSIEGLRLGSKRKAVLDGCLASGSDEAMRLFMLLKDTRHTPFDWDEEPDEGYCGLHDARKDDSQHPKMYTINAIKAVNGSIVLDAEGKPVMEKQIMMGPHFVLGKQRNLWTVPISESDRLDIHRFDAVDDTGKKIRIRATGRTWQPAWRAARAALSTGDYFTIRTTFEQIMAQVGVRDEFELADVVGMLASYASKEHPNWINGEPAGMLPPVGEREDLVEVVLRCLDGTAVWNRLFGDWTAVDMLEELGVTEFDGPFAAAESVVGSTDNGWGWMVARLFGTEWDSEEEQPWDWGEIIPVAEALQVVTDRYQHAFVEAMVVGDFDWLQCQQIAANAWKAGLPRFDNASDARAVEFVTRKRVTVPPAEKLAIQALKPAGLVVDGELWPWDVCMAKFPRLELGNGVRGRLIAALHKCKNRGADEFRARLGG